MWAVAVLLGEAWQKCGEQMVRDVPLTQKGYVSSGCLAGRSSVQGLGMDEES